jgi:hypothetical protein
MIGPTTVLGVLGQNCQHDLHPSEYLCCEGLNSGTALHISTSKLSCSLRTKPNIQDKCNEAPKILSSVQSMQVVLSTLGLKRNTAP